MALYGDGSCRLHAVDGKQSVDVQCTVGLDNAGQNSISGMQVDALIDFLVVVQRRMGTLVMDGAREV